MPDPYSQTLRVAFICTANLCRSPMAEYLLRDLAHKRGLNWAVSSAGLQATPGSPMHPLAAAVLKERGIPCTDDFTTRTIDLADLASQDLVLTMEERHRTEILLHSPRLLNRCYPLLQLAHLLRIPTQVTESEDYAEAFKQRAIRARPFAAPLAERDVADPLGHREERFRECADQLSTAFLPLLPEIPAS